MGAVRRHLHRRDREPGDLSPGDRRRARRRSWSCRSPPSARIPRSWRLLPIGSRVVAVNELEQYEGKASGAVTIFTRDAATRRAFAAIASRVAWRGAVLRLDRCARALRPGRQLRRRERDGLPDCSCRDARGGERADAARRSWRGLARARKGRTRTACCWTRRISSPSCRTSGSTASRRTASTRSVERSPSPAATTWCSLPGRGPDTSPSRRTVARCTRPVNWRRR